MRSPVLIASLLFVTGCSFAPRHVRPELASPPEYPSEYAGNVEAGTGAPDVPWREFIADERLESLIATALEHNRDLAIFTARIDEARGLYRIRAPSGSRRSEQAQMRFVPAPARPRQAVRPAATR